MILSLIILGVFLAPQEVVRSPLQSLTPNKICEFDVPLSLFGRGEAAKRPNPPATAHVGVVVPDGFSPARAWPLLIVNAPSGASPVKSLQNYTNIALNAGWVLLAAEGRVDKVEQDTFVWGNAVLHSALASIQKTWPTVMRWPVVCAGFSGGAKRAGAVAPFLSREGMPVIGLFMGGCNEDRVTQAWFIYHPPAYFKSIPIFLSSGIHDQIAKPLQHAAVAKSMAQAGFSHVRLELYDGGHQLDTNHLHMALQWFRDLRKPTNAPPRTNVITAPVAPPNQ